MAAYCRDFEEWGPTSDSRVDVTLCFSNSILLTLSSLLAVIVFGVRAHVLIKNHRNSSQSWYPIPIHRTLYWASLVSMITACAALITRLVQLAISSLSSPSLILASSSLLVAWISAIGVNYLENRVGTKSSTWIFMFHVVCIITGAFNIRTMADVSLTSQPQFASFCVFYASICLGFVIECWPRSNGVYKEMTGIISTGGKKDSKSRAAEKTKEEEEDNWEKPTAYEQANLFSRLCFVFVDPVIFRGYRQPLQAEDVANMMPRRMRTLHTFKLVSRVWDRHLLKFKTFKSAGDSSNTTTSDNSNNNSRKKTNEPSLLWVLFRAGGWSWLPVIMFALTESFMEYIQPVFLDTVLGFIGSYSTDTPQPLALGIILAIAMFASAIISTVAGAQVFQRGFNIGIELKSGLISMIYRKSLKLSPAARHGATIGEITNHMSVDVERIGESISYMPMAVTSPLEIAVATWLLYRKMGPSALTSLGVVILMSPAQAWIGKVLTSAKDKKLAAMDGRIRLLTAILSGMKAVKLYSWEQSFKAKLLAFREVELRYLRRIGNSTAFMMIMYSSLPSFMALMSFVVYALWGGPGGTRGIMSAQVVFVSISLFNRLSVPIGRASQIISQAITLKVAVKRIQGFLLQEEMNDTLTGSYHFDQAEEVTKNSSDILIQDGTFTWDDPSSACPSTPATSTSSETVSEAKQVDMVDGASEKSIGEGKRATLSDINLKVMSSSLTVVMGRVGQGKSSLINAIIGDMYCLQGSVKVNGQLAYVAQEAWIMNCSVRDNILFGKPLDQVRYERVIHACSLQQDLEMLPAGDQTEIGERGINLSGGQKQRVSLARAAYQDADIYLLDDPLSAVDAHVDQHLWENLIGPQGLLKDKTRLLITHGIHHLFEVDHIVVIKDGAVAEQGKYQELMDARSSFFQLIDEYSHKSEKRQEEGEITEAEGVKFTVEGSDGQDKGDRYVIKEGGAQGVAFDPNDNDDDDDNADLIIKEEAAVGSIGWSIFRQYAAAATYLYSFMSVAGFLFSQASQVGINFWLKTWAGQEGKAEQPSVAKFLGVYAVIVALYVFFDMGSNMVILNFGGIRATRILHRKLLENVMKLPMSFFDTTPVGRIVNRFSSDVDNVDELIPLSISDFYFFLTTVLGSLLVISISLPIFLALIPLLFVLYYILQLLFIRSSRQLKRMHSISKSPLYQHFAETLAGVSTIRAMKVQDKFILENSIKADQSTNAYYIYTIVIRWLHIRLEALGAIVILATALLAVLGRASLGPELAGLALTYAMNTTFAISLLMKSYSELQNQLVSVERIGEYTRKNQEAPSSLPSDARLPSGWPNQGTIEFKSYSTRYRQGLDLVIKDVSFKVEPRQRIGVVGRTGAGKSSLMLALFRIVEAANSHWAKASHNGPTLSPSLKELPPKGTSIPEEIARSQVSKGSAKSNRLEPIQIHVEGEDEEQDGGSIEIDGVDISTVGLERLRKHLAIIPQDPTLFTGTIRENLDPFSEATDTEVWEALERAHLKEYITTLSGGLTAEVAQNGDNFSVGQRSLLCLARALLRKTKILVLDEATAAVDVETDELIQRTIREEFQDRTILTIAHRIKTIMDYDKILVLDRGHVEEFDTPGELLKKRGTFYRLAQQAGENTDQGRGH